MSAGSDITSTAGRHTPVLYQHVLSALNLRAGGRYIDGTVGAGGHAHGILEATAPDGMLLGLDRDPGALLAAGARLEEFGTRVRLVHSSFSEMKTAANQAGWEGVQGILLDLGISSLQLEDPGRGFSFRVTGPIDMRLDPGSPVTAGDLVNTLDEDELAEILFQFGEEERARRVARAIVAERPFSTTVELAQVVRRIAGGRPGKIDPATKTFQALRIAVNEELEALQQGLEASLELLSGGGRLVVISFHSLEDRIVKQFISRESKDCVCPPEIPVCMCGHHAAFRVVAKRPIRPDEEEIGTNPRSRSARMRVAEKL
jgi:16S rRNA (cytosine1402-N4)-methyltransferase